MIERLRIVNFKQFDDVDLDLTGTVVFVGPNNSGKTTILQALSLWELGLRRWIEKAPPENNMGVTVNRKDLASVPVPSSNLLWRNLRVANLIPSHDYDIRIYVSGSTQGKPWECELEFVYANEESFYVRPARPDWSADSFALANQTRIAFLPPMSGLAAEEYFKQLGEIRYLIGQGQTAQVLRNLCFQLFRDQAESWRSLVLRLHEMFGVELSDPELNPERSEITLSYRDIRKPRIIFDLSSSGRGLQQVLLCLVYVHLNPTSVLLLDEPDAHLEVLRQREIFRTLQDLTSQLGSQLLIASHSEVIMNEAADLGSVVSLVGRPHLVQTRSSQLRKALTSIAWDQYFQAEQKGWVLYGEDSTDLRILQAFARKVQHPAGDHLETVFFHAIRSNVPQHAREHFFGIREAKHDLVGIAVFDHLDVLLQDHDALSEVMWRRREIENYFATPTVLRRWAASSAELYVDEKRVRVMDESIDEIAGALELLGEDAWGEGTKVSEDVLQRIFARFFKRLELPVSFRKADYYRLVDLLEPDEVPEEVIAVLDRICSTAEKARPTT